VFNNLLIIYNRADALSLGSSTSPITISATVVMNKGDQVWIRKYDGDAASMYGGSLSVFQGYKL